MIAMPVVKALAQRLLLWPACGSVFAAMTSYLRERALARGSSTTFAVLPATMPER